MSSGPLHDLQIPRRAAGLRILAFTVLSAGFLMLGAIAATDGHALLLVAAAAALVAVLVIAAGEGYRLRQTKYGRVEVHTLFRIKQLDLSRGFEVADGWLGTRMVRITTPARRVRLIGSIGGTILVREWLEVAASR